MGGDKKESLIRKEYCICRSQLYRENMKMFNTRGRKVLDQCPMTLKPEEQLEDS